MQKLQRLTPEVKRIQAKYKEGKQRQQQELMKLYQEHGVNPFASCLPLVAQLPVFISLYYMLRSNLRADICPTIQPGYSEVLHKVVSHAHTRACGSHGHAGFLFIHDLTSKATGATLIVLITLYVGSQLASQLLMATPQMDKTQRNLMLLLPLFFVIVVIRFPAALLVYWITTNLWTMGQQYFIRRRLGPITPLVAADGGGGRAGGSGPSGGGDSDTGPNGAGAGGLGGLPGGRSKSAEAPSAAATRSRTSTPPPPPRKRKKRSGSAEIAVSESLHAPA